MPPAPVPRAVSPGAGGGAGGGGPVCRGSPGTVPGGGHRWGPGSDTPDVSADNRPGAGARTLARVICRSGCGEVRVPVRDLHVWDLMLPRGEPVTGFSFRCPGCGRRTVEPVDDPGRREALWGLGVPVARIGVPAELAERSRVAGPLHDPGPGWVPDTPGHWPGL